MPSIYEKYNLKQVINTSGRMTALGVSTPRPEVVQAAMDGMNHYFEMKDLVNKTGEYIAKLLEVEGATVVSCASAGIAQSVAAVLVKDSDWLLENLHVTPIENNEIVLPKGHNVNFGAPVGTMVALGGGKLVLVDRTRPWMLEKYFDAAHFRILDKPVDQQTLFRELCGQLEGEGFVGAEFLESVIEREAIVSTMLGDGIALPHSLGLLAQKTVVYTVLAPQGIQWGDETAHVIFLLAISKSEYEEAMAIYDIFVTFLRERAMARLCQCENFAAFKAEAMESLSRF